MVAHERAVTEKEQLGHSRIVRDAMWACAALLMTDVHLAPPAETGDRFSPADFPLAAIALLDIPGYSVTADPPAH
jgi:hypothetical protein